MKIINKKIYINIEYKIILINKPELLILLSQIKIRKMILSFYIKGLKSAIYNINEYILILIYISIIKNGIIIFYRITRKIYLVNNLKTYILIDNNIIEPEKIVLDIN